MNHGLRRLIVPVLLILASAPALGGNEREAREWIERMATSMNHLSYQGTFVYVRGDLMETMRITHVVDQEGVRERLYSVTGSRREIIRDATGVRCVMGEDGSMLQDAVSSGAIFPQFPLDDMAADTSSYRFETGGTARVAGQMGRRVTIVPKDEFRYGYDLWLETGSGLLLKWVLFDAERNALAKLVFTDLRFGEEVDLDELQSDSPPEAFTLLPNAMPSNEVKTRARPEWQPESLPPGFHLAAHRHLADGESVFEHLVYSDGLASVSVYIETMPEKGRVNPGLTRIGTANAFTRNLDGRQVTVIGEVPAATVRAIGGSFKPALQSR